MRDYTFESKKKHVAFVDCSNGQEEDNFAEIEVTYSYG
jgi:hypothetical protein